jgi:uncharacterized protein DUF6985
MRVSDLGEFERDAYGALLSEPRPVAAFDGLQCRFELQGYEGDLNPEDFVQAMRNVLTAPQSLLRDATPFVHQYCVEMLRLWGDAAPSLELVSPADVWNYVELGNVLVVSRDHRSDRDVFVSLECWCAWEREHGLQLVFKNGAEISKVGPFDGHVSNASAFNDRSLDGVVYKARGA